MILWILKMELPILMGRKGKYFFIFFTVLRKYNIEETILSPYQTMTLSGR